MAVVFMGRDKAVYCYEKERGFFHPPEELCVCRVHDRHEGTVG